MAAGPQLQSPQAKPLIRTQSILPKPPELMPAGPSSQRALRRAIQRAYTNGTGINARDRRRLQRALGQQGLAELIARGRAAPRPSGGQVQAKLTVGPAGDRYEEEADRVANQVMRKLATPSASTPVAPDPAPAEPAAQRSQATAAPAATTAVTPPSAAVVSSAPLPITPIQRTFQAANLVGGDEGSGEWATGGEPGGREFLVQREVGLEGGPVDGDVESSIRRAKGGGRPLDPKVRTSMEGAFGADFSRVRVHNNRESDTLNRSLSAQAFTTGSDIFFKGNGYNPGSSGGQRLLAHELTHVVQQTGPGVRRKPDAAPAQTIRHVDRRPDKQTIRRQLTFDDYSWSGYKLALWSSYNKESAQAELNAPFIELERRVEELSAAKEPFTDQEDSTKLSRIKQFIHRRKVIPVQWAEREAVLVEINTHLEQAKALAHAPRSAPKPYVSPTLLSALTGMPQWNRFRPYQPPSVLTMSAVLAMGMYMHLQQGGSPLPLGDGSGGGEGELVERPPDTTEAGGVTTLSIPGSPNRPILTAELTEPVFDLEEKSSVKVGAIRLAVDELNTVELPLALALFYSRREGFEGDAVLTRPAKVNNFLTLNTFRGAYRNRSLDVQGKAQVALPGVVPFEAEVQYTPDLGLTVSATRIELLVPPINGSEAHGVLTELKYSTRTGFFDGRGQFEAKLPILGVGQANLVVHKNKFQEVSLRFDEIAYPEKSPAIRGRASGSAQFDELGRFSKGAFAADVKFLMPDSSGKAQDGRLAASASIEEGKFNAALKLDKAVYINDYLTLNAVDIKVVNGVVEGGGELTSQFGPQKLPFTTGDDQQLGDTTPAESEKKGKEFSYSITHGYEWDRGFWVRGEANIPISPWDKKMLTGVLTYSKGALSASVETLDAVLVPRIPFVKNLYSLEKNVMLRGIGKKGKGLGGIYATAQIDLSFYYNFGPISVDAHGTLTNIDLKGLKADLDPLHIEELRGGLAAELKGRPNVGLGAYALNERLLNVQGGIEMPLAAAFQANVVSHLGPLTYKDGKFTGPKLDLELPIVFGVSGALKPYINIYALNGLIDLNPPLEPIASIELLKARQLMPGKVDVNVIRAATPDSLGELVPTNLDSAPEAKTEEPTLAPGVSILEVRPKPPALLRSDPGKGGMPTKPINLQALLAKVGTGLPLERLEQLMDALVKLADRFGITGGIQKVIEWLDAHYLLEPLRMGSAAIDKLIEIVAAEVELSLQKLWEVFKVDPSKEGGEASAELPEMPRLSYGDLRAESLVLLLGHSRIAVDVPTTEGTHPGKITKNPLEPYGITLMKDQPEPTFTFDNNKKLIGGKITAKLTVGDFATIAGVELAVDGDKNIAQSFTNGNFDPNEQKLPGLHTHRTNGSFTNTQFFLSGVNLESKAPAPPIANPMPGASEPLRTPDEIELNFAQLDKEWVLLGQGIKYRGLAIKVNLLKYSKNDKGEVSATGQVSVTLENFGLAKAKVEMAAGEFRRLDFTFTSVTKRYTFGGNPVASSESSDGGSGELTAPKSEAPALDPDKPGIFGYVTGGFVVQSQKLQGFDAAAHFSLQHASVNAGKPVELVGAVKSDGSLKPQMKLELKTSPVSLMQGLASLNQLKVDYDGRNGKLNGAGMASFTFPGKEPSTEKQEEEAGHSKPPKPEGASETPPQPKEGTPPQDPGTLTGKLVFTEEGTSLDLQGSSVENDYFSLRQIQIAYLKGKGWNLGGKATVKGIYGFESIQASVYYSSGTDIRQGSKLGFRIDKSDKTTMQEPPGIRLTPDFTTLEYAFKSKTFSGEGHLGIAFPVAGTPTSATGLFQIKNNRLTGFGVEIATTVRVPVLNPLFKGKVGGEVSYKDGKLGGELTGKLNAIQPGEEGGGKSQNKDKSGPSLTKKSEGVDFNLRVDKEGVTGRISQQGAIELGGGLVTVRDVNLRLDRVPNVRATAELLNKQGGNIGALGQDGSSIIRKNGISGGGKLTADINGVGGGSLALDYADGEFKRTTGWIFLGPNPDKNAKPTLAGNVMASYSTREGFAIEKGTITTNLTPGLQASGTLERQPGSAVENGLTAKLAVDATLLEKGYTKKTLFKALAQPVIPVIPGLFSLYGEAGADFTVEYGVSPIRLQGEAELNNISLKTLKYATAFVRLQKAKSEKGRKETGGLYAKFTGKPYFGIGAAALHPSVVGVSGGLAIPVSAEAALDPALDTRLVYDKDGNLKGRFQLDLPLAMGAKVAVTPYIKGTALAGLLNLTWEPRKPLAEYELIKPRVVYQKTLDFGNLVESDKPLEADVPSSFEQTKPATPALVAEQKVEAEPPEPVAPPKVEPKIGDADPTSDLSKSGPFSFAGLTGKVKQGYAATVKGVKKVYASIKEVAAGLGKLALKTGEVIGSGFKSVATQVSTAITDVASWIYTWYGGKTDQALKAVETSEDLREVPKVENFNWQRFGLRRGFADIYMDQMDPFSGGSLYPPRGFYGSRFDL